MSELTDRLRLYVLLTSKHSSKPLIDAAKLVIEGGATAVQLREKRCADSELLEKARAVRELTRRAGVLIVNFFVAGQQKRLGRQIKLSL